MIQFGAVVAEDSGEVIAICDAISGAIYRSFREPHEPGEIVSMGKWVPRDDENGYTQRIHSRILAIATQEEMKPIVAGIMAQCDRIKKKHPRFASGAWYRVLED
jgi:hypothetical protein